MAGQLIKDCVYRFLRLPPLCRYFADTYEFQRLREIRQLGIVHFVYPSAVHTRHEHSLGVMHLAGKMVDVLRTSGAFVTDREKDLIQLAGLLHDVGHIALSHFLDHMLLVAGHAGHEERSVVLVREMNRRLGLLNAREERMVVKMVLGDSTDEPRPFLFQIVANKGSGLDVDRLDYLARDAYHAGMPSFQPDYLVECARVQDGELCFLSKARHEVELMYQARTRMFRQVYRHPTVIRVEQTLIQCIFPPDIIEWVQENWRTLDDVELTSYLRKSPQYHRMYTRNWADAPAVPEPAAAAESADSVVYV
jgi:deoxynucleoside triphosphate triphosphohydrolase SAMHD1